MELKDELGKPMDIHWSEGEINRVRERRGSERMGVSTGPKGRLWCERSCPGLRETWTECTIARKVVQRVN